MGGVLENNILIRWSGVVLRVYVLSTFTYGVIVKKNNFRIQYIPSLYLIGYTEIIDFCEIMLKLALNTNQSINQLIFFNNFCFFVILGVHILHFNTEKNIMKFLYHYDQLNCYTVHFVFVQYVS